MTKAQTVLNNFLNNIKISSVPPILISGEAITNIVERANIFNELFASQCTPLEKNKRLNTDKHLNTVYIKTDDIISTTKSLNPIKDHGFDNITIRMIQQCGDFITTLVQIFKSSLSQGVFPNTWNNSCS